MICASCASPVMNVGGCTTERSPSYFSAMTDERKETDQGAGGPVRIRNADGTAYEVPVEGSLALLALGYKGLMAWRAKRQQVRRDANEARPKP